MEIWQNSQNLKLIYMLLLKKSYHIRSDVYFVDNTASHTK